MEFKSCGIKGEDANIGYIMDIDSIEKQKLINWNNVSEGFKNDFLAKYSEAYGYIEDISGDELEIGIDMFIVLDHIGVLINKNKTLMKSFKEIYSGLENQLRG